MPEIDAELRRRAEAWLADDPEEMTRSELEELLARGDAEGLADRFRGELEFGTAGLRGLVGAGPNRMNERVVLRATAGLCQWLEMQVEDAAERGVCIGFDGRTTSRRLAEVAAEVVAGAGFRVHAFDEVVPTPVLAFSVLDRSAAAGIMVTASHNPPQYNGYKVYWENGAQIIPPHDEGIAGCIGAVERVRDLPRRSSSEATSRGSYTRLGEDLIRRYLDGVRSLAIHPELPRELTIAYTALHGVGDWFVRSALSEQGFTRVHSVAAQAEPDGRFPTVDFPNPEEKGAMDLVLALARETDADVVLANDPDADRLAVAAKDAGGRYVSLNGNEIGCLLAHYVLDQGPHDRGRMVLSSIVSSPMLGAIASAHGAHFEQTLTGFKWIMNRALELARDEELRFVFGYEEALGYTVGTLVRDKDGVGAAAVMADMAAWCHAEGRTLIDERDRMYRRYGLFLSDQISVVLPGSDGSERIDAAMAALRDDPPPELAGTKVAAYSDLLAGSRRPAGGPTEDLGFPPSNVVVVELEGGHRVMARPSGTEPKIKFYVDVRVDVEAREDLDGARTRGTAVLRSLGDAFLARAGLERPA